MNGLFGLVLLFAVCYYGVWFDALSARSVLGNEGNEYLGR